MPIPKWFVNGLLMNAPPGGTILCELDPPFIQHMTIEVLVHCAFTRVELRHSAADQSRRNTLLVADNATVYVTVEPGDTLRLYWLPISNEQYVQGSLYVF